MGAHDAQRSVSRGKGRRAPWVLGVSASHNGSACLLKGDEIVAAIQEERLVRVKRQRIYGAAPCLSVSYCLDYAGIRPSELDLVVLCVQGKARARAQDILLNPQLRVSLHGVRTLTISHHLGHAVSAFATSGFEESAVLVVDGIGSPYEDLNPDERTRVLGRARGGWESISLYSARGAGISAVEKHLVRGDKWLGKRRSSMPTFRSLGGMYSAAATQIFGDPMEGAGQVMGLAPYGEAKFPASDFFDVVDGQFLFRDKVPARFPHGRRWPECQGQYSDLARSVQEALEVAILYLARRLRAAAPSENLCYAGGVALNCVANERLIRESGFKRLHIMPAAEDSGPAVGAAFYGLWQLTARNTRYRLVSDSLGRKYEKAAVDGAIKKTPAVTVLSSPRDVLEETAERLCRGQFAGWFQGGAELGPRALGHRSILADPRKPGAKAALNERVKFRAAFRPFAPSILYEEADKWFECGDTGAESPFMLRVCRFKPHLRERVPAVVHIDGTGRVQTVTKGANGKFYQLLRRFYARTGVPILLNTSFNISGEPIVETPEDALWCLLYTGLDFCVIDDEIVTKAQGFNSILDLYPRITAAGCSIEFPITDGRLVDALSAGKRASFLVSFPWGESYQSLPDYVINILRFIDGKSDGWTVLNRLAAEFGGAMDQKRLVEIFGSLRQSAVIDFRAHRV
jgi:carbamoyltransferase